MIRSSLAVLGLAIASPVLANPKADQLAAEGKAAAAAGDFKRAAELFASAFREDPSLTNAFCNIGVSYFKAGELPRAHLLLTLCVQRATLELDVRDNANAVIASIDEQLRAGGHTPVTITVRPDNVATTIVEFGPVSQFVGPRNVWLPFGTWHLEHALDGHVPSTTTLETVDQKPRSVEVTLTRSAVKPIAAAPKPPAPPTRPSKALPIAVSIGAVATGVLAVIAFGRAHSEADRAPFALDQEALDTIDDRVGTWNTVFGISTAVTVVTGIASGYLWYRATRAPKTRVEVTPTAGGAAVTFGGRF